MNDFLARFASSSAGDADIRTIQFKFPMAKIVAAAAFAFAVCIFGAGYLATLASAQSGGPNDDQELRSFSGDTATTRGFVFHDGTLVSPVSDAFGVSTTSTGASNWTEANAEIKETARALGYEPELIFEYVKGHIEFHPVFGAVKGPTGAIIDREGSSFDQAWLLNELLREAHDVGGKNVQASMSFGTITLTDPVQIEKWLGARDAGSVCRLLAAGGFPATVNGTTNCQSLMSPATSVVMGHAWVNVTWNGVTSIWDPGFKQHLLNNAPLRDNLASLSASYLSNSTSAVTLVGHSTTPIDIGRGFSLSTIQNNVKSIADQVETARISECIACSIEQAIGIPELNPDVAGQYVATGGTYSPFLSTSGGVPDQLRTKLTVKLQCGTTPCSGPTHEIASVALFTDQIEGRRLWLRAGDMTISAVPRSFKIDLLREDDVLWSSSTAPAPFTTAAFNKRSPTVLLSIDHPYGGTGQTQGDRTIAYRNVPLVFSVNIVHGAGQHSDELVQRASRESRRELKYPFLEMRPEIGSPTKTSARNDETAFLVGAAWQRDMTRASQIHAAIADSQFIHHYSAGLVLRETGGLKQITDTPPGLASLATMTNVTYVADGAENWSVGNESLIPDISTTASTVKLLTTEANTDALRRAIATTAAELEALALKSILGTPFASSTGEKIAWALAPTNAHALTDTAVNWSHSGSQTSTYAYQGGQDVLLIPPNTAIGETANLFQANGGTNDLTRYVLSMRTELSDLLANGWTIVAVRETFLGPGARLGSCLPYAGGQPWSTSNQCTANLARGGVFIAFKDGTSRILHATGTIWGFRKGGAAASPRLNNFLNPAVLTHVVGATGSPFIEGLVNPMSGDAAGTIAGTLDTGEGELGLQISIPSAATPAPWGHRRWKADQEITATVATNPTAAMQSNNLKAAISTFAAFSAMQQAYAASGSNSETLKREIVGPVVAQWWGEQIVHNSVRLDLGGSSREFVRPFNQGAYPSAGTDSSVATLSAPPRLEADDVYFGTKSISWRNSSTAHTHTPISITVDFPDKDRLVLNSVFESGMHASDPQYETSVFNNQIRQYFVAESWTTKHDTSLNYQWEKEPCVAHTTDSSARTYVAGTECAYRLKRVERRYGSEVVVAIDYIRGDRPNNGTFRTASGSGGPRELKIEEKFVSGAPALVVTRPDGTIQGATFEVRDFQPASGSGNRPGYRELLSGWFAPRDGLATAGGVLANTTNPLAKLTHDRLGHVSALNIRSTDISATPHVYRTYGFGTASGALVRSKDPIGGVTLARNDSFGRLVSVQDPMQRVGRATYDGLGRIVETTAAWGNRTAYEYDALSNITRVRQIPKSVSGDPDWWMQTPEIRAYYRDPQWPHKPTRIVQPWTPDFGDQTTYWNGADGTAPFIHSTEFTYDNNGLVTQVIQPRTFDAITGNDLRGVWSFEYDHGRVKKQTDPTSLVTTFQFGEGDNPEFCMTKTTVDPGLLGFNLNLVTQFGCDPIGNIVSTTNARGKVSTDHFDAMRRRTRTDGPAGTNIATLWTFDADGNTVREERQESAGIWRQTNSTYSPTGKVLLTTDPAGDRVRSCYDANDRVRMVVAPDDSVTQGGSAATNGGRAIVSTYNAAGEPTLIENWFSAQLNDATCALTAVTPPASPSANVSSKESAHQYRALSYNSGGLLASEEDANGNATTFTYDGLGRVIQTNFAPTTVLIGSVPTTFSQYQVHLRDQRGQLIHSYARGGGWSRRYYDGAGRTTHAIEQAPNEDGTAFEWKQGQLFTYDLAGNGVTSAVFNYPAWTYRDLRIQHFDRAARPNQEWVYPAYYSGSPLYWYLEHGFDEASNRTRLRWHDGWEAHWSYDDANRMTNARLGTNSSNADNYPLAQATFQWDGLSRRTGVSRHTSGGGASTAYSWEHDSDLAQITHAFPAGATPSAIFTYATNPSGQLGAVTINASAFEWSPPTSGYARAQGVATVLNQITADGAHAVVWSPAGNMASAPLDATGAITRFVHDGANRLVVAERADNTMKAVYDYDAADRRVSKAVTIGGSGGTTTVTRTLWSGTDEIAELAQDLSGDWRILRRVLTGPGIDDRVAMIEHGTYDIPKYFHTDRLGSVIATSKINNTYQGEIDQAFSYGPYGESNAPSTGNPWRYTGRYLDAETGLYYYRARYYSPRLGQFLQTDPIGTKDDPNLYMYVALDPGNATDPTGTKIEFKDREGNVVSRNAATDAALAQLGKSPTASAELSALHDSSETYFIQETRGDTLFQHWDRTIQFNPNQGGLLPGGDVLSPALLLGHDISHAAEQVRVGAETYASWFEPIVSYDASKPNRASLTIGPNPARRVEENRATAVERFIARELGEAERHAYSDGSPVVTTGPTSRTICRRPSGGACP